MSSRKPLQRFSLHIESRFWSPVETFFTMSSPAMLWCSTLNITQSWINFRQSDCIFIVPVLSPLAINEVGSSRRRPSSKPRKCRCRQNSRQRRQDLQRIWRIARFQRSLHQSGDISLNFIFPHRFLLVTVAVVFEPLILGSQVDYSTNWKISEKIDVMLLIYP